MTDPRSGCTTRYLDAAVAPLQRQPNDSHPSISPAGRWLWLVDGRIGYVIHGGLPQPPMELGPGPLDPHPQCRPSGRFVVWMSTARGQVDLAITSIDPFTDLP